MNVDTMRNIDRYAGVPITFLLGLVYWVLYRITPRRKVAVENALFIELSEMGSAIIADPAMRRLRDETGATLHFVIFKQNAKSLSLPGTIPEENIYQVREDLLS